MIEKLLNVKELKEEFIYVPYLDYNKHEVSKEIFEENGIPQPEGNLPVFNVVMKANNYVPDQLTSKINDKYEQDILFKLLDKAETIDGAEDEAKELFSLADMKIYDATKRFIANTIVCNSHMKYLIEKVQHEEAGDKDYPFKNVIYTDLMPTHLFLLLVVPEDLLSYVAVVVKNDTNYLLDIVNSNLMKKVYLFEKCSYKVPEECSMYDMCYCVANNCSTPCARKKGPSGICTVSDFTRVCSDYQE